MQKLLFKKHCNTNQKFEGKPTTGITIACEFLHVTYVGRLLTVCDIFGLQYHIKYLDWLHKLGKSRY